MDFILTNGYVVGVVDETTQKVIACLMGYEVMSDLPEDTSLLTEK